MENKNKSSIIVIVILGIVILGLIGYICYDKGLFGKNESANNTEEVEEKVTDKENNNDTEKENDLNDKKTDQNVIDNNIQEINIRTYRYFGYLEGHSPDMYTTLKLYSNGNYDYYVNVCSGVTKYSGTYNETNTKISLLGNITTVLSGDISFNKVDNGNSLELNFDNPSCNETGGSFSLESHVLGE